MRPDYSVALHARDLAALITGLGPAPAHLVTASFGGCVALHLAAERPELVRTLVLGEPPLLPWLAQLPGGASLAEAFMATAWEPARRAFLAGDAEAGARAFLDGVIGRPAFDHLPAERRQMIMDNAAELSAETRSSNLFSSFDCAIARRIVRPVLLVTGELSPPMFHVIVQELARCLPQAAIGTDSERLTRHAGVQSACL